VTPETPIVAAVVPPHMVEFGPTFYALAVAFLLFVFFLFLFVRRTLTGFKEGVEDGKRN
jgi:hypothetical protein